MPRTFQQLSTDEFQGLVNIFPFTRQIDAVHVHHTWKPRHKDYKGHETIVGMWRYHTENKGWSDIAQHVTIAPDGTIWTGRDWNTPPASARGHNGNEVSGPFMIEVIGDFDVGQDRFEGNQRDAAFRVIAAIQQKYGLPAESLRLHNQMSAKTCPGTSVDYKGLKDELRGVLAAVERETAQTKASRGVQDRPFGDDVLAIHGIIDQMGNGTRTINPLDEELQEGEDRDGYDKFIQQARGIGAQSGNGGVSNELTPDLLQELRPHVINLTQGIFSKDGRFQTTAGDVDAIFKQHLVRWTEDMKAKKKKTKLLFYAHGGLTSEASGLLMSHQQMRWWKANDIYPIFFVWETGLMETLKQLFAASQQQLQRAIPRDFWDHTTDPLIERFCHAFGGVTIWSGMKRSAEQAVAEGGGALYAINTLNEFCRSHGSDVELYGAGHSAGSIFHSHFIPKALAAGVPAFEELYFLAPAVRVDTFRKQLEPEMGKGVKRLTLFTMNKDMERADQCGAIYRKSLLYLIYYALEPEKETPILGLEQSLRESSGLRSLFGLDGSPSTVGGEVVWSKTVSPKGRSASTSASHGGFDNDAPTMNSVAKRVLGLGDTDPLKDFPAAATRAVSDIWSQPKDWPEALESLSRPPIVGPSNTAVSSGGRMYTPAPQTLRQGGGRAAGRRRALCVGIDLYPTAPLAGCVADAKAWSQTLLRLGFDEPRILLDQEATRASILEALRDLITSAAMGDVVVFQYAGHGTQLPDADRDEAGGDTPDQDEALCPFDFAEGKFVVDDDVADVFRQIPDGVNVTCFIDCCHSGTITRFAVGGPRLLGPGRRARYLVATPAMKQAHLEFRRSLGRRSLGSRGPETMREVTFAACLSSEVALENNGHGDFTVRATKVLEGGIQGITHAQFQESVTAAFGSQPQQHANLDCAPAARDRLLLEPVALSGEGPRLPAEQPWSVSWPHTVSAANGGETASEAVSQLFKALTVLLETKGK